MNDLRAKPVSPISQLLQSIGLTRGDLERHSDQMRQFLTAEDVRSSRVFSSEILDTRHARSTSASLSKSQSSRRSTSIASASFVSQTPPPPMTPIKTEPSETSVSLRHKDSMELVIERKSRQNRREKRGRRERERLSSPPGVLPSLDAFMQSRDTRRVPSVDSSIVSRGPTPQHDIVLAPPLTPQPCKYYRNYDNDEPSTSRLRKATFSPRPESPTPTRLQRRMVPAQAGDYNPVTPHHHKYYKSPLPSSSPPQSSPFVTPVKQVADIVSSPGPMGPLPTEDEYDRLPYTLPPGPYSKAKPDLPYAALVGQAILSSPRHRLTLQEIYDWITIVYPHFQRNETTWMNSIRHVLSTMVCFRKETRERIHGRTLWAIWDCDLECFANGSFRKEFCADMQDQSGKKRAQKKREAEDPPTARKKKKAKIDATPTHDQGSFLSETSVPVAGSSCSSSNLLPLFPPLARSNLPHQPYYEQCQPLSTGMIFPPLPPTSGYQRMVSASSGTTSATASSSSLPPSSATKTTEYSPSSPLPHSSSLPELTPHRSSSSPMLPSEGPSHSEEHARPTIVSTPVLDSGHATIALAPGFALQDCAQDGLQQDPQKLLRKKSRGLPPIPVSPTLERRSKNRNQRPAADAKASSKPFIFPRVRTSTPPLAPSPSTPPQKHKELIQLSPIHTPISHKGLHMSPSPSLAHYKSNLDPPRIASFNADDSINPAVFHADHMYTPTRKRVMSHGGPHQKDGFSIFAPATPRKLIFPASNSSQTNANESPFRTPGANLILDPHDPSTLLADEFARVGEESPMGLFGGKRGLLYESPNVPSPGKWGNWW